jgi:hypothetical protein
VHVVNALRWLRTHREEMQRLLEAPRISATVRELDGDSRLVAEPGAPQRGFHATLPRMAGPGIAARMVHETSSECARLRLALRLSSLWVSR